MFDSVLILFSQKLRKELEETQQKLAEAKTKLQSVESKSGWFERRLTETEVVFKSLYSLASYFVFVSNRMI